VLRGLWALVVLVPITVACALPATVVSLLHRRSHATLRAARVWARVMLAAVGARVEYVDLDNCYARLPCVYVANHQSAVDIWALLRVVPPETLFVAKRSLFRIPLLGWAMASGGFVAIDRENRHRALVSLRAAAARIRAGRPVVLFPEGTRSREGRLMPFKRGPFHLALEAGVPLVPVAIQGSGRVLPPGGFRVRPGPVRVQFLPALELTEHPADDTGALLRRVQEAIAGALAGGSASESAGGG
jgi:1-acyl-sn-glycerol-3-phosphate acyltransferase